MPRMLMKRPSPVSLDNEMPGMRLRDSAALKSGYLAIVSADCTVIRLGAASWTSRAASSLRGAVTTTSRRLLAPASLAAASAQAPVAMARRLTPDARAARCCSVRAAGAAARRA